MASVIRTEQLYPDLARYVQARLGEDDAIDAARRAQLDALSAWVSAQRADGSPIRLTFICTHNSRRSHMGQIWAHVAALVFGFDGVEAYSGGTEATAFNARAVAAMGRAGFHIAAVNDGDNPPFEVRLGPQLAGLTVFSKRFDDPANPSAGFAAVMTCGQADAECPFVPGAAFRAAITYEDPKAFDDTDRAEAMYDERAAQIGREMLYLFSKVGP